MLQPPGRLACLADLCRRFGRLVQAEPLREASLVGYMRRAVLAGLVLAFIGCGTQDVRIEFRLAETEPTAGLAEFVLPGSDETFYLHNDAAIGNADVASATVVQHGGGPVIELLLTRQGAARLAEFTAANLKKRVAILVDGKLVSAPLINAPITGGRVIVQDGFSEDEALRIAEALRSHRLDG